MTILFHIVGGVIFRDGSLAKLLQKFVECGFGIRAQDVCNMPRRRYRCRAFAGRLGKLLKTWAYRSQ